MIEVDGPIHYTEENKRYDNGRSQALCEFKIDVIRFTNEQVLNDIELVLKEIQDRLATRPASLKEASAHYIYRVGVLPSQSQRAAA